MEVTEQMQFNELRKNKSFLFEI